MESPTLTLDRPGAAGSASAPVRRVDCCVVGGGPAGVVLALLLARQGVDVLLLEAHQDFDRDFRGDTVHPSTVDLIEQLGLLDQLRALPHVCVTDFPFHLPDGSVSPPARRHRGVEHPTYEVPQARFLAMLVDEAKRFGSFHLALGARVEGLVERDGAVVGVTFRAADGWHEVATPLVVGADGRFSKVRQLAGMPLAGRAEPLDVLWLRLPRRPDDPERARGIYLGADGVLVVVERPDSWQIGYLLPKGGYQRLREAGLEQLRRSVAIRAHWLADRTDCLESWRQTSLLVVEAGRVRRWFRPGLLLIGDAAHVMSPVAGVGINYAIQDAVAAANILGPGLRRGAVRVRDLAAVQRRREWPTRLMQLLQRQMRPRFAVDGRPVARRPRVASLLDVWPIGELRARLIAFGGLRPERVRELAPARRSLASRLGALVRGAVDWRALCCAGGVWWVPTDEAQG